jgi:hypothetical protein
LPGGVQAQKLEGQIRTLELQKADRTRCFGRNMPALLDAINRCVRQLPR